VQSTAHWPTRRIIGCEARNFSGHLGWRICLWHVDG
jgi:hypothetical protein